MLGTSIHRGWPRPNPGNGARTPPSAERFDGGRSSESPLLAGAHHRIPRPLCPMRQPCNTAPPFTRPPARRLRCVGLLHHQWQAGVSRITCPGGAARPRAGKAAAFPGSIRAHRCLSVVEGHRPAPPPHGRKPRSPAHKPHSPVHDPVSQANPPLPQDDPPVPDPDSPLSLADLPVSEDDLPGVLPGHPRPVSKTSGQVSSPS